MFLGAIGEPTLLRTFIETVTHIAKNLASEPDRAALSLVECVF